MKKLDKEKRNFASLPNILLILLLLGISVLVRFSSGDVLTIVDQKTKDQYLSISVNESDILTFHWIHSFEHIPWKEEYLILDNGTLLLKNISIAGFGAGIPHNDGKVTTMENGSIIMKEIDEEFNEINWIHSQTAVDYIELNGQIIIRGIDLPHHEALRLKIEKRLKI